MSFICAQHSFQWRRFFRRPSRMSATLNKSAGSRGWASLPPEYAIPVQRPSLDEARSYCRALATSHYENFSVATWFLPSNCISISTMCMPTAASRTIWATR